MSGEERPAAPPTVSVCMPAYRDGPHFREAVGSALHQTLTDLEVIVTDDGRGALRATVESFGDPRLRYVENPEPLGFAGNHVRALDEARGRYVAVLHQDDRWEPEFLEAAVAALEAHPDAGMAVTGADDIDGDGVLLGPRPARMTGGPQDDALALFLARDFMLMLPSLMVFRRDALEAENRRPWPDSDVGDVTMYLDLAAAGWRLVFVDRQLAAYRSHGDQASARLVGHRRAISAMWGSYSFTEPHHEALRRARTAEALVSQAGAEVRQGSARAARAALLRAARLSPRAIRPRWLALLVLSFTRPVAEPLHRRWTRLRDPVAERHRG